MQLSRTVTQYKKTRDTIMSTPTMGPDTLQCASLELVGAAVS